LTTRDQILHRIRTARADTGFTDIPIPARSPRPSTEIDLIDRFTAHATDYRATVVRTGSPRSTIAEVLTRRGITSLVVPSGFPESLLPQGPWSVLTDDPPLSTVQLDAAAGVITTATTAIAATGTIVLDGGPGQGRRALSLLPDYHLCVLAGSAVVQGVTQALARLDPTSPLTLISGPSATSDIELDRVEGVHGPRVLDIVITT
jgi:L-lactate dehydrogenase complex protein LldG